ncbi:kinase-like domain-containing protein [Gautieria morchelliformis]|nr:kinase-like domain-containing protein [Gautieria morchelliformis]
MALDTNSEDRSLNPAKGERSEHRGGARNGRTERLGIGNKHVMTLQWHGNRPPEEATEVMALGEFYQSHQVLPHANVYLDNIPKQHNKIKGKCVCLKLWINEEGWEAWIDHDLSLHKGMGKKRGSSSGDSDHAKWPCGPMESSFVFSKWPSVMFSEPKDKIQLQFAKTRVVEQTGKVEVQWKVGEVHVEGEICRTPLGQGKSKHVYALTIGEMAYVAKHFFNIGKGEGIVTVDENASQLEAEIWRVKRGQWFWKWFKETAHRHHREIATDIQFVEAILAQEDLRHGSEPSVASHTSSKCVEDSDCRAIYWLLEEQRTLVVNNYSYTLSHLSAFTHFTWMHSQNTLLFADMQGSPARGSDGQPVEILFDPMTHSPTEDTGLGDYDQQGIDAFISQHRCNKICEK